MYRYLFKYIYIGTDLMVIFIYSYIDRPRPWLFDPSSACGRFEKIIFFNSSYIYVYRYRTHFSVDLQIEFHRDPYAAAAYNLYLECKSRSRSHDSSVYECARARERVWVCAVFVLLLFKKNFFVSRVTRFLSLSLRGTVTTGAVFCF